MYDSFLVKQEEVEEFIEEEEKEEKEDITVLEDPPKNETIRDVFKVVPKIPPKSYLSIIMLMFIMYLIYMNLAAFLPQQTKTIEIEDTLLDFTIFPPPQEFAKVVLPGESESQKCYMSQTCEQGIVFPQVMQLGNETGPPNGTQVVIFASLDFTTWWVAGVSTQKEIMKGPFQNVTIEDVCVAYPQFHYLVGCLLPPYLTSQFARSSQVYDDLIPFTFCERIATYCGGVCSYVFSEQDYCLENNTIQLNKLIPTNNNMTSGVFTYREIYHQPMTFILVFAFAKFIILKNVENSGLFPLPKKNRRNEMPPREEEKQLTLSQCSTYSGESFDIISRSVITSVVSHLKYMNNRKSKLKSEPVAPLPKPMGNINQLHGEDELEINGQGNEKRTLQFRFLIYFDKVVDHPKTTKDDVNKFRSLLTLVVRLHCLLKVPQKHALLCSLAEKMLRLVEDDATNIKKMKDGFNSEELRLYNELTNTKKFVDRVDYREAFDLNPYGMRVYESFESFENYRIVILHPLADFFDKRDKRGIFDRLFKPELFSSFTFSKPSNVFQEAVNFVFERSVKSPGKYDGIEACRRYLLLKDKIERKRYSDNDQNEPDAIKNNPGKYIFMGILDARHAPRAEFWMVSLSQFYEIKPRPKRMKKSEAKINIPQDGQKQNVVRIDRMRSTQQIQQFEVDRQSDEIGRECGHFFYITNFLRNRKKVVTSSGSQSFTHLGIDRRRKDFSFQFAVVEDLATSIYYILRGEEFGFTAYQDVVFSTMKSEEDFFISLMRWSSGSIEVLFKTLFSRDIIWLLFGVLLVNIVPAIVTIFAYYSVLRVSSFVLYNILLILVYLFWILICQTHFFQSIFVLYACLTFPINTCITSFFWMIFVVGYLSLGFVIECNPLVITLLAIFSVFVTLTLERAIIFLQEQQGHQVGGKGADTIFSAHAFKNWITSPTISPFIILAGIIGYFDRPKWNMNIFKKIFKWGIRLQCSLYAAFIMTPFILQFFNKLFPQHSVIPWIQKQNIDLASAGWIGAALAGLYLIICLPKLFLTSKGNKHFGNISIALIFAFGTICVALFLFPGVTWQHFTFKSNYVFYNTGTEENPDYSVYLEKINDFIAAHPNITRKIIEDSLEGGSSFLFK